jgi:uncharacterized membrane protein YidH (DUF202 family)
MKSDKSLSIEPGATPTHLRISLFAAFLALALQIGLNYVFEQHACQAQSKIPFHAVSVCAVLLTIAGAILGFAVLRNLPAEKDEEGGQPHDRAHFEALLAIGFNVSFGVAIIAIAIPPWLVPPC